MPSDGNAINILHSRKLLSTINLAVFADFTAVSKVNSLKSYCYAMIVSKINLQNLLLRDKHCPENSCYTGLHHYTYLALIH